MKDEREDPKTKRGQDARIEYGQLTREDEPEPAPYDVAPPGTPDDQVITKGERERPGPTADELQASEDELTPEIDRQGGATFRRGDPGDLGGDELQRRNEPTA
jgi:hypothetical protein